MIRKAIIVVLTLGAVTVIVAEFVGFAVGPVVHVHGDLEVTVNGADLWVLRLDSEGPCQNPQSTPGWVPLVYAKFCGGRLDTLHLPLWLLVLLCSGYPILAFLRGPFRRWHRRGSTSNQLVGGCWYADAA